MLKYSFGIVIVAIFVVGACSSIDLPGTGGTSNPQVIQQTGHPEVPEGVSCYVCHKEDIPGFEFHARYSNDCSQCHIQSTWMASDYSHPEWYLDANHRTRCTRCHIASNVRDYTQYQCWGCHHEEQATRQLHTNRSINDISNCIVCHRNVDTSGPVENN